jgi:PPK2 family polyphosphate:nucleotide phosphotransferase
MSHNPRKIWRIAPGASMRLAEIDPSDTAGLPDKDEAKERLAEDSERIDELQDILFAERERSLLIVLQGMDTSGKDGTVKAVFRATGPLGVAVTAFAKPSEEELAHDFLWRVHAACPRRGTIGIFNRSHYEDVLVGRVRKLAPPDVIERRYDDINAFERVLVDSGTTILKFMLHISKEEQRKRLQARLDNPAKRWKFDPGDLEDRALFDRYMDAYERVIERCSTDDAPWHVIPSDHKWARNAAVAAVIRRTLEDMDPRYPEVAWDPADYTVV